VTGTLRRSITVKGPHPLGLGRWEAQIGPTAVYGRIQELGGVTGRGGATVLPARPYVAPTLPAPRRYGRPAPHLPLGMARAIAR
jgi:phage gpG-like protein